MKSESTYSKQDDLNKLPRRGTHKIKSYYRYGVRCPVCRVYHVIDSDEYATDIDMNCNPTSYPE